MPGITNSALQAILDKAARFAVLAVGDPNFDPSFSAGLEVGSAAVLTGTNAIDTYVYATTDLDVIADLLPAALSLDETHPTVPTRFLFSIPSVAALFTALDRHILRMYGVTNLNTYLTSLNSTTPTLRVHDAISTHLKSLSPINVFIPSDLVLGQINVTGAAAGTWVHATSIDKTKNAGAKLVALNSGAVTTNTVLSITGKKFDGTTATLTVTISVLTDAHETNLSDVTKNFVDVTGVTVTSAGTSGDVIKIVAKTDRSIAAA